MRYFDAMMDKYGFDDGMSVPPDAWAMRAVYAKLLNAAAARLGSRFRVGEFDRAGFHNPCMLEFFPDADIASVDDAMRHALAELEEMDVEEAVKVKVSVSRRALARMMAMARGMVHVEGKEVSP